MIQWLLKVPAKTLPHYSNTPNTATILATGGPSLVGGCLQFCSNPALGVADYPGNSPAYIEKLPANIERSVYDIVLSKTFDNGMICATENSVVVDEEIYDKVKEEEFQKVELCATLKPGKKLINLLM